MKDAIFSGRDLSEALELAGRSLGLSPDALRYVVLERGAPGGLGVGATPARIAVLLERPQPRATPGPAQAPEPAPAIREIVAELAAAAGVELAAELVEQASTLHVQLAGPGVELLLEEEGEVLRAFEHVLQRMLARPLAPRRLRLECPGYRERRDARLQALAQDMAAAVRSDGRSRTTQPLNSYERRLIHLALDGLPDVRTFSVGESSERRVTIARRGEPAES